MRLPQIMTTRGRFLPLTTRPGLRGGGQQGVILPPDALPAAISPDLTNYLHWGTNSDGNALGLSLSTALDILLSALGGSAEFDLGGAPSRWRAINGIQIDAGADTGSSIRIVRSNVGPRADIILNPYLGNLKIVEGNPVSGWPLFTTSGGAYWNLQTAGDTFVVANNGGAVFQVHYPGSLDTDQFYFGIGTGKRLVVYDHAGTTRLFTITDGGTIEMKLVLDMGANEVKNAADPTTAQSLVTKAYGDANYDVAAATHAATSKPTPVNGDEMPLVDSAASNVLKKLTWANLKAALKTYMDTLYIAVGGAVTSLAKSGASALTGAVTLTAGANVTLTQAGQDISIAAAGGGAHILLADGHATPFAFTDLLQMDDGSDFMWSE